MLWDVETALYQLGVRSGRARAPAFVDVGLLHPGPDRLLAVAELAGHAADGPVVGVDLSPQLAYQADGLCPLYLRPENPFGGSLVVMAPFFLPKCRASKEPRVLQAATRSSTAWTSTVKSHPSAARPCTASGSRPTSSATPALCNLEPRASTYPSSLLWLGYDQLDTVQIYLNTDLRIKEQAITAVAAPRVRLGRYRPPDRLLSFLEAL